MKFQSNQDLPIYELKINESLNDESEVSYVALVDLPAIKKDFLAFKEEFINPSKGEHKTEFLPRCISYVINEGKPSEQAVAICNSLWDEHFAEEKVSIDYDDTLSTSRGKDLAKKLIAEGKIVYIISARSELTGMLQTAKDLGIAESRVYATGSNKAKVEKIKELGITKHYDNNSDVVKELGSTGSKFAHSFQIISEDEHIISGPLMLSEELIYRENEKFGAHYVKFSAETIKDIAIKFAKRKYQSNVNLMHDPSQVVEGVTMFESFIVDKKRGVLPMTGFEDVADGSWFGSFYVENNEVWNQVKSGELRGFSVEGLFDYEEPKKQLSPEEQALKKIEELLKEIN
jgi:hypothetical protein